MEKRGDKCTKNNAESSNSKPTGNENFLTYFVQTPSSISRIFIYLLVGIGAAPLGLIVSFIIACGLIATSLSLPILFAPLCFSLYVAFLAYVGWKFLRTLYELANSLEASTKELFKSSMEWLYKKTQRIPFSNRSGVALAKRLEEEGEDENKNVEEDGLEESSSEDLEEASDVRELNVTSVLRISRPKFYRIDSLKNEETERVADATSSSRTINTHKEQFNYDEGDRQKRLLAKNSVRLQDVAIKSYPSHKSEMTGKLEEMRRLLTAIRRRVIVQHPANPVQHTNGQS